MKHPAIAIGFCAALSILTAPLFAEDAPLQGNGQAIVTLTAKGGQESPVLAPGQLQIRINGKAATVTSVAALHGAANPIEMVLLIDNGLRSSLGTQMGEISKFVHEIPTGTKIALAYMQNGQAVLATPLTADAAEAQRSLRVPLGMPGMSASPYFCLSDLAKHWPSKDREARRVVVMITDGVDPYNPRFDPDDNYMLAAIEDSVRAGLTVNSFYWSSFYSRDNSLGGQNLLEIVSQETGGVSYGQGFSNPVSFAPFFDALRKQLRSQYLVRFTAPLEAGIGRLQLKSVGLAAKVEAPQQVLMKPTAPAAE